MTAVNRDASLVEKQTIYAHTKTSSVLMPMGNTFATYGLNTHTHNTAVNKTISN